MRLVKNSSFVNLLELNQYPRIFFLKEQKPQFVRILRSLLPIFEQDNMNLEQALGCVREDEKFMTVRVEEPDLIKY